MSLGMGRIKLFKRNNIKLEKRRRLFALLLKTSFILSSVSILLGGGYYFSNRLETFKIKSVILEGVKDRSLSETLLAKSELHEGMPIFQVNLSEVAKRIRSNLWVDDVIVKRKFPETILIQVFLREPQLILNAKKFYYIGTHGEIFKELEKNDSKDFPILSGLTQKEMEKDFLESHRVIIQALEILAYFEKESFTKELGLSEIHYDLVSGFSLFPEKKKTKILLGKGDFEAKFNRLKATLEKLKTLQHSFTSIDLNYEGKVVLSDSTKKENLE